MFSLGPRFILKHKMDPLSIVDDLDGTKNARLNFDEKGNLFNDLISHNYKHNNNHTKNLKHKQHNTEINVKHLTKILNKWLDDKGLILQMADKNMSICIISKEIYNQALDNLVSNRENYQPIEERDAIYKLICIHEELLELFNKYYQPDLYKIMKNNVTWGFPNLYIIPKTHKPKLGWRPIVNQRNFLYTQIFKDISLFYKNQLFTHPESENYVLQGNLDFLQKIDNLNDIIKRYKLNLSEYDIISLDVTNLYGNIDLDEILKTINKNNNFKSYEKFYYQITKTLLHNNVIEDRGKLYKQINGLAMGINYAPSLANYYLFYNYDLTFKTMLWSPTAISKPILYYGRYLDDILIIYNKNKVKLEKFVSNNLNHIHPSIQFTMENSVNNSINFLDLTLTLNKDNNNQITYKNFTKKNKSNMMLHQTANFRSKDGLLKSQFIRILKNNNTKDGYINDCKLLTANLLLRGYSEEQINNNIIGYDTRVLYMKKDITRDIIKDNNFLTANHDKRLVVLPDHVDLPIVKKHLRQKHAKDKKECLFITKNYKNLYNVFFHNHKNTKFKWSRKTGKLVERRNAKGQLTQPSFVKNKPIIDWLKKQTIKKDE